MPLRLGLAGFGRLARDYYLPALATLPDVRLVAIADPAAASRAAAQTRCPDARVYDALPPMLEAAGLDALLVAAPPSAHFAAWRAAHAVGVPAFVEKPLLLAHELPLVVARERDARVMVDFNRRFWSPYGRARAAILAGKLGAPVTLEFQLHVDARRWSTVTDHRAEPGEGGLVNDLGCHAIDVATWLLGDAPNEISAVAAAIRRPEDRLTLTLGFPGGATARADLAHAGPTRERFAAVGPAGRLWQDEPNMALHFRRAGARTSALAARTLDVAVLGYRALRRSQSMGRASIRGALAAFVAALRTGEAFTPGVAEGLWNARCVAAAARSAAAGGVPLRP